MKIWKKTTRDEEGIENISTFDI